MAAVWAARKTQYLHEYLQADAGFLKALGLLEQSPPLAAADTVLGQTQHQLLVDMRVDLQESFHRVYKKRKESRSVTPAEAQEEDRRSFQEIVQRSRRLVDAVSRLLGPDHSVTERVKDHLKGNEDLYRKLFRQEP